METSERIFVEHPRIRFVGGRKRVRDCEERVLSSGGIAGHGSDPPLEVQLVGDGLFQAAVAILERASMQPTPSTRGKSCLEH